MVPGQHTPLTFLLQLDSFLVCFSDSSSSVRSLKSDFLRFLLFSLYMFSLGNLFGSHGFKCNLCATGYRFNCITATLGHQWRWDAPRSYILLRKTEALPVTWRNSFLRINCKTNSIFRSVRMWKRYTQELVICCKMFCVNELLFTNT